MSQEAVECSTCLYSDVEGEDPPCRDCRHYRKWRSRSMTLVARQPESVPASETVGIKYDQGKPRMDLLDAYAIEQLAEVLTFGAQKYAAHNWRGGIAKSRLLAAAFRHLFAYLGGQDKDPETGLSHVAHAMCCCMFLLGLEHRPELDDRYKEVKNG